MAELSFRKNLCRYFEMKAERHDKARAARVNRHTLYDTHTHVHTHTHTHTHK